MPVAHPPDAPGGLCLGCVLLGVAGPTNPSQAFTASTPTIEEVAAAFPDLEVLEFIGQGGLGVVFKARQPRLDRLVALKILPPALAAEPGFAERFTREARVLARLAHPHIVAIYDFGEGAGFFYLIMEYVNGVNLRAAMRAGVKPEQALLLVPRICEALQFAHDHGVLHRDIKPENILLDTTGMPKLADFGIAKFAGETSVATGLTVTGAALGTAAYMAPEQVEKPATVDHRADIYSLGVVLYEMLTGELPLGRFAAPSEKSSVNRGVDEVVMRALEKERERRQQSATEMKTEVEHANPHGEPVDGAGSSGEDPEPLWPRIFGTLTALSAVGIPVVAMLGWKTANPVHMLALTMVFGTLSGLASAYSRETGTAASTGLARSSTVKRKEKDLGMAHVFWVLLGLVGGHRFYLGQTGWGLLYLFTVGGFMIGWFIDLFTLPDQVRRYNEHRGISPNLAASRRARTSSNPWPLRAVLGILLLLAVTLGVYVWKYGSFKAQIDGRTPTLRIHFEKK
jgi:tRNA A-37 threonylcarbamoyl transferase component Bud32